MPLRESIAIKNGFIDDVELLAGRLLRITGWSVDDPHNLITVMVNGKQAEASAAFRTYRQDVREATGNADPFLGFVQEYILEPALNAKIDVIQAGQSVYSMMPTVEAWPDYPELLSTDRVLGRQAIYYEGPPAEVAMPEIMALALQLPEPILDFGCGGCGPLRALLDAGRGVQGIEVAGSLAAAAIPKDLRSRVTIYDGTFPMPFADGSFASVLATEVIEHIPNFPGAIAEISRIAARQALFTVPDNSVIPICARTGLIPRHYLIADHYNFFTQQSLAATLGPHFKKVEIYRAPLVRISNVLTYSNILAMCYKG